MRLFNKTSEQHNANLELRILFYNKEGFFKDILMAWSKNIVCIV